jgi:hypothetical protein
VLLDLYDVSLFLFLLYFDDGLIVYERNKDREKRSKFIFVGGLQYYNIVVYCHFFRLRKSEKIEIDNYIIILKTTQQYKLTLLFPIFIPFIEQTSSAPFSKLDSC